MYVFYRHDTIEKETDGIDLSTTCTFTVGSQDAWKVIKGEICKETDEEGTDMQGNFTNRL